MSVTIHTMETDVLDIVINQNAPFSLSLDYGDDVGNGLFATGDTIQFRIRSSQNDDSPLLADFSSYFAVADTRNAAIVVPSTQTAALDFDSGYYTIHLVRGGIVAARLQQGRATLDRST